MATKDNNWYRRKFLKAAGVAGVGSVIAPMANRLRASDKHPAIPTRLDIAEGIAGQDPLRTIV